MNLCSQTLSHVQQELLITSTSSWRNFSPSLCTEQLHLWDVVGFSHMNCSHNISIGLRSGLWRGQSSLVERLVCCLTHFLLRLSSWTDFLMRFSGTFQNSLFHQSCLGLDARKQTQTIMLPPPCFTAGIRFCMLFSFSFSSRNCLLTYLVNLGTNFL